MVHNNFRRFVIIPIGLGSLLTVVDLYSYLITYIHLYNHSRPYLPSTYSLKWTWLLSEVCKGFCNHIPPRRLSLTSHNRACFLVYFFFLNTRHKLSTNTKEQSYSASIIWECQWQKPSITGLIECHILKSIKRVLNISFNT